jgi:hypothetical protein
MKARWMMAVGLAAALAACGGSDGGDGGGGPDAGAADDFCTEPGSVCAHLHAPADFTGTPRQIIAGLYESLPPQGPPLVVVTIDDDPAIGIDQVYDMVADEIDLDEPGTYYIYIVLYVEGGGQFVPEPGIDYVVQTEAKVRVGDDPVNLSDMVFSLATE